MLVAYGPDGQHVVADETPLEQLQQWSKERVLHCPNCRGSVHVRGGPDKQIQLHFAHQRGECAWSTEAESVRHMQGKIVLSRWLEAQFPKATVRLEERLPEPNRIADIFILHENGKRWAVEFQCAPLSFEEWSHRHNAYRKAGILDIWVVGVNRREKQEAFIETVIASAHEILFLDPLITPPHVWLRWPVSHATVLEWEHETEQHGRHGRHGWNGRHPTIGEWVGRSGYGATLSGDLQEITLNQQGRFDHPVRSSLEEQTHLRNRLQSSATFDETLLIAYMRQYVEVEAVQQVVVPLIRAFTRDPDLLRRYNYGRGLPHQQVSDEDKSRISNAKRWLETLEQQGYSPTYLQTLSKKVPFFGPYASFAKYIDILSSLASTEDFA